MSCKALYFAGLDTCIGLGIVVWCGWATVTAGACVRLWCFSLSLRLRSDLQKLAALCASTDRDSGLHMQGQTTGTVDADPDDHRIKLFYFVFVDLMRKSTAHSYGLIKGF